MKELNVRLILTTGLLLLLLAACDEGYAPASIDLYEAEAIAKRARAQTEEAAQVTRQAVAQETRQAARTREASIYEMELIDKQIEGTAVAYAMGATVAAGTAQAESARVTQVAFIAQTTANAAATATAWPQTAVPLQATQAAIMARTEYAAARANLEVVGEIARYAVIVIALALIINKLINALTLRYYVVNTIAGPASITKDEYGIYRPQLMSANPNKPITDVRIREIPGVVSLNRSGTVLSSPPISEDERLRRNLINVIKAAIVLTDENAQRLPRWDKIKTVIPTMTSEKMQGYVDILEQMGLVEVSPSVGTFTVGGRSLEMVKYELETNQVRIPDLSPAD